MKLDFILSETVAGSVEAAVDEIVKKSQSNDQILVLVPEDSSLMIEKLALKKVCATANINIYSFVRLLEKLSNKNKDKYIDRECSILIVRKIILDNFDSLVCFKKSAKSLGFAELIYDTISQLKASKVTPQDVLAMQDKVNVSLKIKLHDIALIYEKYQNYLLERYLDSCDKLDLLLEVAKESEFIKNSFVYVVGFDNLTNQGAELIELLSKVSRGVKVACPYVSSKKANAHISDNELYQKLISIANKHNIKYNPVFVAQNFSKTQRHLCDNLYAYPYKTMDCTGGVVLFEGISPRSEVEFVATQIYNDLYKGKITPNDVCIICPDFETYSNFLEIEFKDRNIPLFINKSQELTSHPLFTFIKNALSAIRRGFESEDVLVFCKNPLLELGDDVDIFENYCLKFGINHYAFLNPFTLGKSSENEFNISNEIRANVAKILTSLKEKIDECKSTASFSNAVLNFLEEINIKNRLENLYQTELELDEKSAKVTEQVYDKCQSILNNLTTFLQDNDSTLDEFIALFDAAIQTSKINILPLTLSCVVCSEDISSISPKIKQIYHLGVLDGVVPYKKQDLGLIADSELGSLGDLLEKKIEPTIKTVNRRERFKVYNMVLLASEKLTLTYPIFSNSGEECKPSSLIDSISKLFTQKDLPQRIITSYETALSYGQENANLALYFGAKDNAEKKLIELARQEKDNVCLMDEKNVSALYFALKDNLSEVSKICLLQLGEPVVFEKIENAKELFFKNKTVSISELERYFACPYSHFAVYGLGLKERELGGIKALDVGNILHKVCEKFIKMLDKANEDNIDRFAQKVLDDSVNELEVAVEGNGLILSILKGEALRLCRVLFYESQISSFKTRACELGFTSKKTNFRDGIKLSGKVDRIDVWQDYFKIVDYKTGNVSVASEDVYYGKKIQLISYLNAFSGFENKKPAGVLYFPIKNKFADGEDKVSDLYKNSGIILNDASVCMALDNTLSLDNPKSHIIKAELKNNAQTRESGELVLKQNDNLVSDEVISGLMKYVYELSNKAIGEILDGFALPSPLDFGGGKLPCDYCPLKNCCGVKLTEFSSGRKMLSKISYEKIAQVNYENNKLDN